MIIPLHRPGAVLRQGSWQAQVTQGTINPQGGFVLRSAQPQRPDFSPLLFCTGLHPSTFPVLEASGLPPLVNTE